MGKRAKKAKHAKATLTVTTRTVDATEALGSYLATFLKAGDIVLLNGQMGAGKTCMVRGVAKGLGIAPELVHSPTFGLVHHYEGPLRLVHADLYRLTHARDLREIGIESLLQGAPFEDEPQSITVIEWPDQLATKFPSQAFSIKMDLVKDSDAEDGYHRLIQLTAKPWQARGLQSNRLKEF